MEENEQLTVVRKNNRALRKINKQLRRALQDLKEYSDMLFLELCNEPEIQNSDE